MTRDILRIEHAEDCKGPYHSAALQCSGPQPALSAVYSLEGHRDWRYGCFPETIHRYWNLSDMARDANPEFVMRVYCVPDHAIIADDVQCIFDPDHAVYVGSIMLADLHGLAS